MCINMTTNFHKRDISHDKLTSPFNNVKEGWCISAFYETNVQHKKNTMQFILCAFEQTRF